MQGVGFRPMVYNFALKHNIDGSVCNTNDGVHIVFNTKLEAAEFAQELIANAPPLARITHFSLEETTPVSFHGFRILEGITSAAGNTPLTPDFAICEKCKQELNDPNNRRYRYPFITCTQCGPRFSIVQAMPYDRVHTSMAAFEMCDVCKKEYGSIQDRRFFSQTNSCHNCGVQVTLWNAAGVPITSDSNFALSNIKKELTKGSIIAVKGIGGFLLLCDATNERAIQRLRERKQRKTKPLAVLCKDMDQVKELTICSSREEDALNSTAAPIVVLKQKNDLAQKIAIAAIAPGVNSLGVVLPYAPLLQLIAQDFGKPLVATSANVSGAPIIFENQTALQQLNKIADYLLTHNREIVLPQDDSVVQFTASNQRILLRRSRGYAPSFFPDEVQSSESIIAMGALMKSSFSLLHLQNTYVSQFLGSTDSYDAQVTYQLAVSYFLKMMGASPKFVVTDMHPGYYTTDLGNQLAKSVKAKCIAVQHHKAHFAAVLAENHLLDSDLPVLGVVWDGTGWGEDGNSWGGEFFSYYNNRMHRIHWFDYFPVLLNDKMAREPRLSALALCFGKASAEVHLKEKFTDQEWKLYNRLLEQPANVQTSSVGRILDAIACLLGLCCKQTYEGEAALYLQNTAAAFFEKIDAPQLTSYFSEITKDAAISTNALVQGVLDDIGKGKSKEYIAARVHFSLVHSIVMVAEQADFKMICVSGGVFQNGLLVHLLHQQMGDKRQVFIHQQLAPNDENSSFGQLCYYLNNVDAIQELRLRNSSITNESAEKLTTTVIE